MVEIKQVQDKNQVLNVKLNLEGSDIQHINIRAIADGSRSMGKILEKIALANCLNDTADLNFYSEKEIQTNGPEILTPIFVDNLIMFGITAEKRINKKTKVCIDAGRHSSKIKDFLAPF